ncbi:hypothetical protein ACFP3I_04410 [Chryseobacterium arachidis]|uniref:hypothetical protein n=1 Tax=Chryseobacterium arachidis TaxID=1416778 RepID=UPI00361209A2
MIINVKQQRKQILCFSAVGFKWIMNVYSYFYHRFHLRLLKLNPIGFFPTFNL